jgi:hypothetical protein
VSQKPRAAVAALSIAAVAQLSFISLSIVRADACGLRLLFRAWPFARPLAALLVPFGAPPALTVAAGLAWEAILVSGALVAGAFALVAIREALAPAAQPPR